ncbi:MAG: Rieske 2Fe-2S domain-containing protein [Thermomicrobiales bacterium]
MAQWVKLTDLDQAPPVGRGWPYETEAGDIAMFNVDGEFFAIAGDCPHQGAPLGMGQLSGTLVTCPGHGLRYDVVTGLKPGSDRGVQTYPLEVRDDGIFVDIDVSVD